MKTLEGGVFRDRRDAGRRLAGLLGAYAGRRDALVLALPRGGVPVGYEVAAALRLPLDVFLVRKLGLPDNPELAMGAIALGGVCVLNETLIEALPKAKDALPEITARETAELERREALYREGRPPPPTQGRAVILVDDGLATGSTMRAAARALRQRRPARIVVAVPVGAPAACAALEREADEVLCVRAPDAFGAVGEFYEDFSATSDGEVRELLARAAARADHFNKSPDS